MFRLHVEYERLIYKPTTFSKSRKNYSDSRNCNHCEKNYLSNYLGLMTKYNVSNITCQTDFILGGGAPKSLHMVIAAMKLKDAYSLEGKL